jgi:hypothetical protein
MNRVTDTEEIEELSDSDDEQNESAFAGIQPTFKELVRMTKRQLYGCIVRGPPITSKKAQDNRLLITYVSTTNSLYQLCQQLQKLSAPEIANKLSRFPLPTQHGIKQLLDWLTVFFSKNKYEDTIPYHDYLEVQLKWYPCSQK